MLKRLYHWMLGLAGHPYADRWLGFISFLESSIFPIPPDVMLIPMALARPGRALRYAAIATATSVLGAIAGYFIGYLLFETIGQPILNFYGYAPEFERLQEGFAKYGSLAVLIFGMTPLPFKVITIASGVAAMPLLPFIAASIAARGARFFILAALLWRFGRPIQLFIDRWFNLLAIAFTVLLIGGFLAVEFFI